MQERVRICDIAEELGLSTATVSNVIHGKTDKVSDATVQRVTALLEERQYIPSMAGILLAQNSSGIIGVFVNDHPKYAGHTLSDGFLASSLDHLSTEIERSGQFMMVKKAQSAGDVVRFASMWNMDGIVMLGFCEQDYTDLRRHIRIPIVVYDGLCRDPERLLNLSLDNYGGGEQVGRHFLELGHRQLLCISDNETGIDRERIEGFRHGAAPGTVGLLLVPMQREARWACYRRELEQLRQATAVFAVSDFYALDLMCFLSEQGIAVPDDISVAGFDDTPMCELIRPALTTVRQDGALRAKLAVEKLRELREGKPAPPELTLPVSLVVRGSTGSCSRSIWGRKTARRRGGVFSGTFCSGWALPRSLLRSARCFRGRSCASIQRTPRPGRQRLRIWRCFPARFCLWPAPRFFPLRFAARKSRGCRCTRALCPPF